jgi:hypothetical protein
MNDPSFIVLTETKFSTQYTDFATRYTALLHNALTLLHNILTLLLYAGDGVPGDGLGLDRVSVAD